MPLSESPEHMRIKCLISDRLATWTGASIVEYPSSGHELDIFAATPQGVSIYVEIIWTPTERNFLRDMNMLQQSDADVKLVVANPEIIANQGYVREFSKIVISQRRMGIRVHGELINGECLITDSTYADTVLKDAVLGLLDQVAVHGREAVGRGEFVPPVPPSADKVEEQLISNLFPVQHYPSQLSSAPTAARTEAEVFEKLGSEIGGQPFLVKGGRIYTFSDLAAPNSAFSLIVQRDKVQSEQVAVWLQDEVKRRDLIRLFNLALRVYCKGRRLWYEKEQRRYLCTLKGAKDNYITWKAGSRFTRRALAKRVFDTKGNLLYCRHLAAALEFLFIDGMFFLKINPTMAFTYDGREPFAKDRLASLVRRWLPHLFNDSYVLLVRLWAKLLSRFEVVVSIPAGGDRIEIAASPMNARLHVGIRETKSAALRSPRPRIEGDAPEEE